MTHPRIGEVVHYVSYGTPGGEFPSVCRAAIVAGRDVDDERRRDLVVLNPNGQFFNERVKYAAAGDMKGGSWHPLRECDQ